VHNALNSLFSLFFIINIIVYPSTYFLIMHLQCRAYLSNSAPCLHFEGLKSLFRREAFPAEFSVWGGVESQNSEGVSGVLRGFYRPFTVKKFKVGGGGCRELGG